MINEVKIENFDLDFLFYSFPTIFCIRQMGHTGLKSSLSAEFFTCPWLRASGVFQRLFYKIIS